MQFLQPSTPSAVATFIADKLKAHLGRGETALWLVPGGSAIEVAVESARLLEGSDVSRLTVTLTDERFGPVGHADSNWQQLLDAGFSLSGATLLPVLTGQGKEATAIAYEDHIEHLLTASDYTLGFFGIGPDGHTSGILPDSPAVEAEGYVTSYSANFERITTTFKSISELDEAVVFAMGESKWPVIDRFEEDVPLREMPAQILKQVKRTTVFNDRKGDTI